MTTLPHLTEISVPSTLISHTDVDVHRRGITVVVASDPRRVLRPDPHTLVIRPNPRRRRPDARHHHRRGTLIDPVIHSYEHRTLALVHEWALTCGHVRPGGCDQVLLNVDMLDDLAAFLRRHGRLDIAERVRHAIDVLTHHPVAAVWYCTGS